MSKGQRKGGQFERETIAEISKWFTYGARDDVFRRSATSGGRATIRKKKGKKTFGQYGDVAIADPIGQPLLDICTIEMKTGYKNQSLLETVDGKSVQTTYSKFILQCQEEQQSAGVPFWVLIARRHGQKKMIYMPKKLWLLLQRNLRCYTLKDVIPKVRLRFELQNPKTKTKKGLVQAQIVDVYGTTLETFFETVDPSLFIKHKDAIITWSKT